MLAATPGSVPGTEGTARGKAENAEAFIRLVGDRVRALRKSAKLTRRGLAEVSGVSERYLATLEGGRGNVSLEVLYKLSGALALPVDRLLIPEPALFDEMQRLSALYADAGPEARARAIAALEAPGAAESARGARVCLIGLRGAGKSSLGARVARVFDIPFIELNSEITRRTGMPIAEIMALYGMAAYRRFEAEALGAIIDTHPRALIAAAGGIVEEPETFALMRARCHTIWLRAAPEEHMERVRAQGDLRPMAGSPRAMEELEALLTARASLYGAADHALDTRGRGLDHCADALARLIRTRGLLCA